MAEDPLSCPIPPLHALSKAAASRAPAHPRFHQDFAPSDFLPSVLQAGLRWRAAVLSNAQIRAKQFRLRMEKSLTATSALAEAGEGTLQPCHGQIRVSIARHIQQGPWP